MLKSAIKITCRPYDGNSKTKAFIELCLDETLIIKGMTLVEGSKGLFLSFPSTKGKNGKYYNSIYSIDKEFMGQLEEACIKKYNVVCKDSDNSIKQQFS